MSTQATSPPPAGRPARKARVFILGLLLAGLIGPLGLLYAGYQAYRAKSEVSIYSGAASLYRSRMDAIHRLYDMETAFHRFLLDGNSANLTLMQRDKEAIDQLAHRDPAGDDDKLLRDVAAKAQQWQTQVAQPLVDQRKALPSGQGISEDFLAHYRAAGSDLGASSFEMETEKDYNTALQGLADAQRRISIWFSLAYLAAAVGASILAFFLASGALRHVGDLKTAIGS
jgi:hypothetical protein